MESNKEDGLENVVRVTKCWVSSSLEDHGFGVKWILDVPISAGKSKSTEGTEILLDEVDCLFMIVLN